MRRETVLLALVLILVGVYFLLIRLDMGVPELDRLWPVFPLVGGMVLLVSYSQEDRKNPTTVFWGTSLALGSIFFFLITLGDQDYTILAVTWPVFVALVGISFLAFWLVQQPRDWSTLFLAIVALLFGGIALAFNLNPDFVPHFMNLWPAFLILVGLILLLKTIVSKRETEQ
jgi:hypothetical protein